MERSFTFGRGVAKRKSRASEDARPFSFCSRRSQMANSRAPTVPASPNRHSSILSTATKPCQKGCRVERDAPCYLVRPLGLRLPSKVLRRFSADTPNRTVRAVFPHTALRVGLVSSVSLPFAPRLRFTLIPMDAPPYGQAVSDATPHSGLSPIAVFRHYSSRHLICIVPFFTQRPFAPLARASLRDSPSGIPTGVAPLPRYYGLIRLLLSLLRGLPSS